MLQPHSSATAGHECLCASASCMCLSMCLANPIPVTATSRHCLQDRFYCLSSGILSRGATCLSVAAFDAFSACDRRDFFRYEQLQQQLSTVSAAASSSPAHRLVYLQICNYLLLSAFCICLLHSSSSVWLRIAFECHFGVISLLLEAGPQ